MSTEHQRYSFANQRKVINEYASRNGFRVIHSYEDAAKSGLDICHRKGLQTLLHAVVERGVVFQAVLVYDISRWGRFQDDDEAAHYEFLCRSAGVQVLSCAEQFANDGTTVSSIFKNLKRSMAAEYVRELSDKVFAAQRNLAELGFHVGSSPGYGLRRVAIGSDGKLRCQLAPGEFKPYPTDHVALVPGPANEIAVVRRIYDRFVRARGSIGPYDIARELNAGGVGAVHGGPWTPFSVRKLLTSRKYAGTLVWARTTQKLRTTVKPQPKSDWVVKEGAFQPIITPRVFEQAQTVFQKRADRRIAKEKLLRSLQGVLARHGRLCSKLMNCGSSSYGLSTYQRYLGSMRNIYDHFGLSYCPGAFGGRIRGEKSIRERNLLVLRILRSFPQRLALYRVPHAARRLNLLLDRHTKIFVWIANEHKTPGGKEGWRVSPAPNEHDGLVLLCNRRAANPGYRSFYLFRRIDLKCTQYSFGLKDPLLAGALRLKDLTALCSAADLLLQRVS